MIKDLSTSLKAALYERVSAPIAGTYTVSWLIYNWKGVLPLMFGGGDDGLDISERVQEFDKYLHANVWQAGREDIYLDGWVRPDLFLIPLILTAVAVVAIPFAQSKVYDYKEKLKAESLKRKEQNDSELRLTLEQSKELRDDLKKRHEMYEDQRVQMKTINDRENQRLHVELEELKERATFLEDIREKTQQSHQKLQATNDELTEALAQEQATVSNLASTVRGINAQKNEFKSLLSSYKSGDLVSQNIADELSFMCSEKDFEKVNTIYNHLLDVNEGETWSQVLNEVVLFKFLQVNSYDEADSFFTKLIKPYLAQYSLETLHLLQSIWPLNDQVSGRRRAESDFQLIEDIIKEHSTI